MKKTIVLLIFSARLLFAADGGVENIFDLGLNGRPLGMGNAFTAVADDSSALFWNPGALGLLQYSELMLFHTSLFYGTLYDSVTFSFPTIQFGTFAAGVMRVGTGDIIFRDSRDVTLRKQVDAQEFQILLGYGYHPPLPISFGFSIKIDTLDIGGFSSANIAFDTGLMIALSGPDWRRIFKTFEVPHLTVGVDVRNIVSTPKKLVLYPESEALDLRTGVAYYLNFNNDPNHKLLAAFDLDLPFQRTPKAHFGLEYNLFRLFFIRTGYDMDTGFTFGGSLFYGIQLHRFRFDYALALQEIDLSHRFSLTWQFGASVDEKTRLRQAELDREIQAKIDSALADQEKEYNDKIRALNTANSNNLKKLRTDLDARYKAERDKTINDLKAKALDDQKKITDQLNSKYEQERKQLAESYSNRLSQDKQQALDELTRKYEQEKADAVNDLTKKAELERTNLIQQLTSKNEEEKRALVVSYSNQFELNKQKAVTELNNRFAQEKNRVTQQIIGQEKTKRQSYLRAMDLYDKTDYDAAIVMLENLLKTDPNYTEARELLQKVRAARQSPTTYSKEIMDLYRKGVELYVNGDYLKAIDEWKKILKIDAYNNLALQRINEAEKKLSEIEKLKQEK
jgi:hypothetical protein